jgi:hypothetical protein
MSRLTPPAWILISAGPSQVIRMTPVSLPVSPWLQSALPPAAALAVFAPDGAGPVVPDGAVPLVFDPVPLEHPAIMAGVAIANESRLHMDGQLTSNGHIGGDELTGPRGLGAGALSRCVDQTLADQFSHAVMALDRTMAGS